jgi:hypothetical protein
MMASKEQRESKQADGISKGRVKFFSTRMKKKKLDIPLLHPKGGLKEYISVFSFLSAVHSAVCARVYVCVCVHDAFMMRAQTLGQTKTSQ